MKTKEYEVLAKLQYGKPLKVWHRHIFSKWYIVTEEQADWGTYGGFINGEYFIDPPDYISCGLTKKQAWREACIRFNIEKV